MSLISERKSLIEFNSISSSLLNRIGYYANSRLFFDVRITFYTAYLIIEEKIKVLIYLLKIS